MSNQTMNHNPFRKEYHAFAFLMIANLGDAFSEIKKIITERGFNTGASGKALISPIRKWLMYRPADELGLSLLKDGYDNQTVRQQLVLEQSWGIGFRVDKLKKMIPGCRWVPIDNNRDLLCLVLPPSSLVDFRQLDESRDIVVLCPTKEYCEKFFNRGSIRTNSGKVYPKWHWMNMSKNSVINNNRTDEELMEFLHSKFDNRNRLTKDPLMEINALFD